MRHEPRRWKRVIRTAMSALVVGSVFVAVESLAPDLSAQAPECVVGLQQAEAGALTGFEVVSDTTASGGAFIHVPDGTINRWTPSETHRASYCFTIEAAGRYRIATGAAADGGTNDSFFVAVDGTLVDSGRWDVAHGAGFSQDYVNSYQAADPVEVDLTAGDHTVDVYLREDGTKLDTIEFELVTGQPQCRDGWVEAESGVLEGFERTRDRSAHANAAIGIPEGGGSRWYPSAEARAAYCLNASSDGVYVLEADVHAPSTLSDSFFVRVDGGADLMWFPTVSETFTLDTVNSFGVADPVELNLSAGPHLVEVFAREDGTMLDRIRLHQKATPRGRECRNDRLEAEDASLVGFEVGTDGAASGGEFIHRPNGNGSSWSPSDAVAAVFCFDAATAGVYELHGGVWADNGTNDSFWVKVDGGTARRWDVAWHTDYATDVVGFRGNDPFQVELGEGAHVVEVLLREDGTRLDWLGIEPVS